MVTREARGVVGSPGEAAGGQQMPFGVYKRRMRETIRKIAAAHPRHALDEQGVPSYVEGFFLSRWLFWRRIVVAHGLVARHANGSCLDFGCGVGTMLPLLSERFRTVHAVDTEAGVTREAIRLWDEAYGASHRNVRVSTSLQEAGIPERSLDLILALDVLEHVPDPHGTLAEMDRLLKPEGILLISGPTENRLYRFCRWLVGFSGHYHMRSILDIEKAATGLFEVRRLRRLVFPFTLFVLLEARKK
jgi:2-polyprenyl-3-methyl-5-hydroxy-6-metoxy-1,4-benzoquinol methylase